MELGKQVKTHRTLEVICNGVFNKFGIKLFGIPQSHRDTEFIYLLCTDTKLSTRKLKEVCMFIEGIEYGFLAT